MSSAPPRGPLQPHDRQAPTISLVGWRVSLDFHGRRVIERGFRGDQSVTIGEGTGAALCVPGVAAGAREGATLAAGDWLAVVDGIDGEVQISGERRPLAAFREAGGVRLGRGDGATLHLADHPEVVLALQHEMPTPVAWGVRLGLRDLGQHLALGGVLAALFALFSQIEEPVAVVEVKGDPEVVDTALARVLFASMHELPKPPTVARPTIVVPATRPDPEPDPEPIPEVVVGALEGAIEAYEGAEDEARIGIGGIVEDDAAPAPEEMARVLGALDPDVAIVDTLALALDDANSLGELVEIESGVVGGVVGGIEGDEVGVVEVGVVGGVVEGGVVGGVVGRVVGDLPASIDDPPPPPSPSVVAAREVDVVQVVESVGADEHTAPAEGGQHSHAEAGGAAIAGAPSGVAAVATVTCDDPQRAPKDQVDVVFVVDVSTTMGFMLDKVERGIVEVDAAARALAPDPRYGLVVFVDDLLVANEGKPYASIGELQAELARWRSFTASNREIHGAESNLDWPENSLDALHAAATRFAWRPASSTLRLVVHATDDDFGEAPAIQSGQAIQHTYRETVAALRGAEVRVTSFAARLGGQCECLDVKPGLLGSYRGQRSIPDATGGAAFDIDEVASGSLSFAAAVTATIGDTICRAYPLPAKVSRRPAPATVDPIPVTPPPGDGAAGQGSAPQPSP